MNENTPFATLNYPTLLTQSRTLMTAPCGAAVEGVIQRFHELMKTVPDANEMVMNAILYESYSLLRSDAYAALISGAESEKLNIAIHASEVLEELREGTACVVPTGENAELNIVPAELHHRWWKGPRGRRRGPGLRNAGDGDAPDKEFPAGNGGYPEPRRLHPCRCAGRTPS